jgi:hypothetical protein
LLTDSKTIDAEDQEVQSRHHSANATVTSILTNDINNHNDPDDEPRPHFEYKGGTFAYGLGALDKDGYKRSVPLPIPVTSLFRSRSIPKTWVYAQNSNNKRLTLIKDT